MNITEHFSMWRIIGQEKSVDLLRRGLETGSLSHAYLFTGPAHTGKMTLALNLAQALNCEGAERPCNQCNSCRKISEGKYADIRIIAINGSDDSAETKQRTEISIDQIREIQHSASLPPFEGTCKVFIIDGAESLSLEAANSLLKTLEEPEERVVFILLAVNEQLLPETVISRCQIMKLSPVSTAEIEVALIEEHNTEPDNARLLARLSHGCPGWAVTATVDDNLLRQRTEWLDEMVAVINADSGERFTYAAQLATQFSQKRELVYEKLELWLDLWRDLLLIKVDSIGNTTNIDRLDSLSTMAESYSLAQIRDFVKNIQAAGEQLRQNASPRLVLEVLMLDIPENERYNRVKSNA
ncbi:ATP-binding protein [Chloroflexota bacterium]